MPLPSHRDSTDKAFPRAALSFGLSENQLKVSKSFNINFDEKTAVHFYSRTVPVKEPRNKREIPRFKYEFTSRLCGLSPDTRHLD